MLASVNHGMSDLLDAVQCRLPAVRHDVCGIEEAVGSAARLQQVDCQCGIVEDACSAALDEESGRRGFMCAVMYSAGCLCDAYALTGSERCCCASLAWMDFAVPFACGACVLLCGIYARDWECSVGAWCTLLLWMWHDSVVVAQHCIFECVQHAKIIIDSVFVSILVSRAWCFLAWQTYE